MAYVLEATNTAGEFVYYTGRAGDGWVSTEAREGFVFSSDLGDRRAAQFNARAPLTGLIFEKVKVR